MTPRVNVVLPTHNHGRYLPTAIKSVREQKWPGLEIIVVDDGSTDETPRVMEELVGEDLRYIRQANAGVSAARNRGISESSGEWVAFLDADCYWLPQKLERQLRAVEEEKADFAYGGSMLIDDEGNALKVYRPDSKSNLVSALVWGNLFPTSSVIVRRACLEKVGVFDESLPTLGEDWDLWLRLAANYRGISISDPLVAELVSTFAGKYQVQNLEKATLQVISRFFELVQDRSDLASLSNQRRRVMSHHLSVIAKSYLQHKEVAGFVRSSVRCILTHPIGLRYLLISDAEGTDSNFHEPS
jgi:glycosyltransferase involved in cell wall biosynthesis